jgi:hypothetical protein
MTDYSPEDFLRLADAAYQDSAVAIDGLTAVKDLTIADLSDLGYNPKTGYVYNQDTGFRAVLYSNGKTGSQQTFVISYRGTVLNGSLSDARSTLIADQQLATGQIPTQFTKGLDLFNVIKKAFPQASILLAGHSLGGAIAEYVSSVTKKTGLTFGAPGVDVSSPRTTSTFLIDDIDKADPVGTYTGADVFDLKHVGKVTDLGTESVAELLFGKGPLGSLIELGADITHHLLDNYYRLLKIEMVTNPPKHSLFDGVSSILPALLMFDSAITRTIGVPGT